MSLYTCKTARRLAARRCRRTCDCDGHFDNRNNRYEGIIIDEDDGGSAQHWLGRAVDERALVDALRSKLIHAAALEVIEIEPLPPESPLWDLDNMIVSLHISGAGKHGYARFKEVIDKTFHIFVQKNRCAILSIG